MASRGDVYDRLVAGHREIERLGRELTALCNTVSPPDPAVLAAARWNFSRAIIEHVTLKDRHIYANLEKSADPDVRRTVVRIREEQEALHVGFREHITRWTAEAAAADWRGFRVAMMRMHKVLADRVAQEERELHPLVAKMRGAVEAASQAQRNWARDAWVIRDAIRDD